MKEKELLELIAGGEDSRTQFKRGQDVSNIKSLTGELVAFANSKGGRLVIGVDDSGDVTGLCLEDVRRINQLISNAATDCVRPSINPETENVHVKGKLVMIVNVPEGISKPYADNEGVFWVKSGADKRRITAREEIQRMLQRADLVHADGIPVANFNMKDIDREHFSDFIDKQFDMPLDEFLNEEKLTMEQLLNNFGLAKDQSVNLAGVMLFSKDPQKYRPAFIVKCVSFAGNDPAGKRYRDSQDFRGSLRSLYKGTMSFLLRNIKWRQNGKGFNTEGDPEVPVPALEELTVNMLLHRDYFISAPWRVFIFDNRIELISPGALPNNLTIANIRNGVSVIRNPIIASFAAKELPYRGIGTGIMRALAAAPELELESDDERNLFIARIPRKEGS